MDLTRFNNISLVVKKFLEDNNIEINSDFEELKDKEVFSNMLTSAIFQELINPNASSATSTGIRPRKGRPKGSKNRDSRNTAEKEIV
ncbi:MAG: hypothetical protein ACOCUI_04345 [bacterium]